MLDTVSDQLLKLVYFVPTDHAEETRKAVFEAGAGWLNYLELVSVTSAKQLTLTQP